MFPLIVHASLVQILSEMSRSVHIVTCIKGTKQHVRLLYQTKTLGYSSEIYVIILYDESVSMILNQARCVQVSIGKYYENAVCLGINGPEDDFRPKRRPIVVSL